MFFSCEAKWANAAALSNRARMPSAPRRSSTARDASVERMRIVRSPGK
jgi:hypothetical protein